MNQSFRNYLFKVSAVLVFSGAVLYMTRWFYSPYLFAAGAAGITLSFMTEPYQDLDFRLRRLHRINVIAGIAMIVSSVFMFRRQMEWAVFLLIAALLILYTSFAVPRDDK